MKSLPARRRNSARNAARSSEAVRHSNEKAVRRGGFFDQQKEDKAFTAAFFSRGFESF
jgi:hypothetical protein